MGQGVCSVFVFPSDGGGGGYGGGVFLRCMFY